MWRRNERDCASVNTWSLFKQQDCCVQWSFYVMFVTMWTLSTISLCGDVWLNYKFCSKDLGLSTNNHLAHATVSVTVYYQDSLSSRRLYSDRAPPHEGTPSRPRNKDPPFSAAGRPARSHYFLLLAIQHHTNTVLLCYIVILCHMRQCALIQHTCCTSNTHCTCDM